MTTVRELLTKWSFKADTRGVEAFQSKLDSARKFAGVAAKGVAVLGGAAIAAGYGIFKLTKSVAEQAHEIERASQKTGLTTDTLQELQYAAKKTQTPFEAVVGGMRKVAMIAQQAAHGNKAAKQSFKELGVDGIDPTTKKLKSMDQLSVEALFALADLEDGTQKVALAQKFFGRSGVEMLALLREGRYDLAAMMGDAKKSMLSPEEVRQGNELNKSLRSLDATVERLKKRLGVALIPVVRDVAQKLEKWVAANAAVIATKIPEFVDKLVKALKEMFNGVDVAGVMNGITRAISGLIGALQYVVEHTGLVKAAFCSLIGLSVASKLAPIIGKLHGMAGGLGAINASSIAATGGVAGLIGKLAGATGLVALAGAAGVAIGSWVDSQFGLSDKLSDAMVGDDRKRAHDRAMATTGDVNEGNLSRMADQFREMKAHGVTSFGDVGLKQELTGDTVSAKLLEVAGRMGMAQDKSAVLVQDLMKNFDRISTNNNTFSPTITVNVPAGTSPRDAGRIADALTPKLRGAMQDMTAGK